MESPTVLVLVIVALTVVGVGAMAVAGTAAERHRSRALAAWARCRGWRYDRERPELVDRFDGVPFLERRSNARTRHVLCAERRGRRVMAYEYGYTAPHPQHHNRTVTHVYTVVAAALPEAVPLLQVEEVGASPAPPLPVAGAHPWISGQAGFDKRFRVATDGDAFPGTVLGQDTRAWLLSRQGPVPFRFGGRYLLSWERGRLDTERVQARADAVIDLLERIPAGVWEGTQGSLG
ncbi:hypothetical protein A6A08_18165 [Nocardiopsis sp. TSRI0078]|uniref:hypothetical protein n=1 Tax=unclassified Nocardiopsis TaxID=2649073 RepID=UPI0009397C4F|nr:hypothetical protein [Nocardiopsis sp. TSRI0078]OKI22881.1 hypothetical protein A6A08_18165 [Nocardiopsis sp. TSRI0078]